MCSNLGSHLFFIIGYIAIIGSQKIYQDILYEWSTNEVIPALQEHTQPNGEDWYYWSMYSNIIASGHLQQVFMFFSAWILNSQSETQFLFIGYTAQFFLSNVLKNHHHSARPFWDNPYRGTPGEGIYADRCYSQFGNPSGHSINASYFSMYLFFAYILRKYERDEVKIQKQQIVEMEKVNDQETGKQKKKSALNIKDNSFDQWRYTVQVKEGVATSTIVKKDRSLLEMMFIAISFAVLILGFLSVGMSRMILGMHALDQVIYGFFIGLWTVTYMILVWRPVIRGHLYDIRTRRLSKGKLTLLLTMVAVFSISLLALMISVYYKSIMTYKMPGKHIKNIQKCDSRFDFTEDLSSSNLFLAGGVMLPFGIYCGVAYRYYTLESASKEREDAPLLNNGKSSEGSIFVRLPIMLLMLVPGLALLLVIKSSQKSLHPVLALVLGSAIPFWCIGFGLFCGITEKIMRGMN